MKLLLKHFFSHFSRRCITSVFALLPVFASIVPCQSADSADYSQSPQITIGGDNFLDLRSPFSPYFRTLVPEHAFHRSMKISQSSLSSVIYCSFEGPILTGLSVREVSSCVQGALKFSQLDMYAQRIAKKVCDGALADRQDLQVRCCTHSAYGIIGTKTTVVFRTESLSLNTKLFVRETMPETHTFSI